MTIDSLDILLSQFWTSHSTSGLNCCFLTYTQVTQEAGKVVLYSHLFKNFPQFVVILTIKGFSRVNEEEVDFFWNSLAFSMSQWMLAIWSPVPLPFLNPAWTSGSSIHILLKPGLANFEHYFASVWGNCAVVWTFFGIALLWDWNENWPFPVLWPLLSFPKLLAYWVQHCSSIIF